MPEKRPTIIDYENSTYRADFWEGRGRDYEDRVERIALRRLLRTRGKRLLEIGAGFGRLTNEYQGFEQVVLMDYSFSHMQEARDYLGDRGKGNLFVAADVYKLPFKPGVFDAATMIRVIHHISHVKLALAQVRRALTPGSTFILEHANKRNLKAMGRYALKRQTWNPHDRAPVEFVELNFDFHPDHIHDELVGADFIVQQRVPVSLFRLNALKQTIPLPILAGMDGVFQLSGWLVAPSVFVRAQAGSTGTNNVNASSIFACPECGGDLVRQGNEMTCQRDGMRWAIRDGIYDFKAPIDPED